MSDKDFNTDGSPKKDSPKLEKGDARSVLDAEIAAKDKKKKK